MLRQRRVEFGGTMYQVMARGDRREAIVRDERDGRWFESTWGQVAESSGWMVLAWTLTAIITA
jgi:hypothetical protein